MHPFLITQIFALLFKGNDTQTELQDSKRNLNTLLSVETTERRQKQLMVYFCFFMKADGARGKKTSKKQIKKNKKRKNHFHIHTMGYTSSLHLPDDSTAYVQDEPDQGSPIIMLFSVMCGGRCANLLLIWRLRGWSQGLIASWSGTPEPVVLEGIKVPPPCWAALSQQVGVHVLSSHTQVRRSKIDVLPRTRTCWSSAPIPDPEVEQQAKKGKDKRSIKIK